MAEFRPQDAPGKSAALSKNSEELAQDYWRESDGRVTLVAAVCENCGLYFLPKVAVCSACEGMKFRAAALGDRGKLYSYSVVRTAAPGAAVPYTVGYVDFPEGVRVFGYVRNDETVKPRIDGEVGIEMMSLARPGDMQARTYRFVPLLSEGAKS